MVAATAVLAIIIVWSVFSRPLDRHGITSALFLMVAGCVDGTSALGWLDITMGSVFAERVAEIALVLLLFSDAARLDLQSASMTQALWHASPWRGESRVKRSVTGSLTAAPAILTS